MEVIRRITGGGKREREREIYGEIEKSLLLPKNLNLESAIMNGSCGTKWEGKKPLDGKDAWSTIAQGKESPHDLILLNVTPFGGAIRMGDWKLVHNGAAVAGATSAEGPETWELFNLRNDPSEKTNLVETNARVFRRLKSQLDQLEIESVAPHIPPNRLPDNFEVPKIWGHKN